MIRYELLANETKTALRTAAWAADGDREEFVQSWVVQFFAAEPFVPHASAPAVIRALGGVRVEQSGGGKTIARRSFWFDSTGAEGEADRFSRFERKLSTRLCPVGGADDGETYLAMAEDGRVVFLMDEAWEIGTCIDYALNALVIGELGMPIYERVQTTRRPGSPESKANAVQLTSTSATIVGEVSGDVAEQA